MRYGWIKNQPDPRDWNVTKLMPTLAILPNVVYNLKPPVRDQKTLGACVYFTLLYLMQSEELRRGDEMIEVFSPLFAYHDYNVKVNGDPNMDAGAMPRVAASLLVKDGVCLEGTWPYVPSKLAVQPPSAAYKEALDNQVLEYYDLRSEVQRLSTLAQGRNFGCGVAVFDSFEDAPYGQIPNPDVTREKLLGYHMITIWGYNRNLRVYHGINSWGEDWGDMGLFTIPFDYLDNVRLADDFLVIKAIEE